MSIVLLQDSSVAPVHTVTAKLKLDQLFGTGKVAVNPESNLATATLVVVLEPAQIPVSCTGKQVVTLSLQDLLTTQTSQDLTAKATTYEAIATTTTKTATSTVVATEVAQLQSKATNKSLKVVAVTACPSGVAHTFLSASAIEGYCQRQGWQVQVETRGQQGVGNEISPDTVAQADLVFVAADIGIDLSKFNGKLMYRTSTGAALKKTEQEFTKALTQATVYSVAGATDATATTTAAGSSNVAGGSIYSHLMSGVSYMLPITVAGGLLIALSFTFGIEAFKEQGTLAAHLMSIGGGSAFAIMLAVFSGYVAYSIGDRPGLAAGLISGFLVNSLGAGFLGAIVTGFGSGYLAKFLNKSIKLPESLASLKPILILPLLTSLIVGLACIYFVGPVVGGINEALTTQLKSLQGSNAVILGVSLGAMMCTDLGGPVNKAAYLLSVGLLSDGVYNVMAATMAAGMVPPIGMAIATWIAKNKFTKAQRDSGNVAGVLGLCFISEGAIPFAAADPLRVIGTSIVGGAITGALSMALNLQLTAPHGGLFVIPLVSSPLLYLLIIALGSVVTGVSYAFLKRPLEQQ